jgi:hypothetical protein
MTPDDVPLGIECALPPTLRAPDQKASRRSKFILALAALLFLLGAVQLKT